MGNFNNMPGMPDTDIDTPTTGGEGCDLSSKMREMLERLSGLENFIKDKVCDGQSDDDDDDDDDDDEDDDSDDQNNTTKKPDVTVKPVFDWKNGWIAKKEDIDDELQKAWGECVSKAGGNIPSNKKNHVKDIIMALKKTKEALTKDKKKKIKDLKDKNLKKAMQ